MSIDVAAPKSLGYIKWELSSEIHNEVREHPLLLMTGSNKPATKLALSNKKQSII